MPPMCRRAVPTLDYTLQMDNILNLDKIDLLFDGSRALLKVGPDRSRSALLKVFTYLLTGALCTNIYM